jgi:tetratricopeptide (TPR) repeat protein
MDDSFEARVQALVKDQGAEILLNAGKCKSFLADYAPGIEFAKERKLLLRVLEAGSGKFIAEAGDLAEVKRGLVKRLDEEESISPKAGAEMINLLALVLRGDTEKVQAETETIPVNRKPAEAAAVPSKKEEDAERHLDSGLKAFKKKDYGKAAADAKKALELDSTCAAAWFVLGSLNGLKGEYAEAVTNYAEAIKNDPYFVGSYGERNSAYLEKGDPDRMIAECTRAIGLNPNNAKFYSTRGKLYFYKKDFDMAIADHTRSISVNPNDAYAYFCRGDAYIARAQESSTHGAANEDYDRAIVDLNRFLKIKPENDTAQRLLSLAEMMRSLYS